MIADGISEQLDEDPQYVYDRHSYRRKRSKNEIGIHSVRGGTIVGEHEVIFAGHDEVVTISHQAQSKEVFAVGAVNAAVFLKIRKQVCTTWATFFLKNELKNNTFKHGIKAVLSFMSKLCLLS